MKDKEKFEGFKQNLIENNEAAYGAEIRSTYGSDAVDASNQKIKGMSKEQWQYAERLSEQINQTLKEAFELGNPAGDLAQRVCEMHREWLCIYWKEGMYSKEAHCALADSYVADERFTAYYDRFGKGCTRFLRDAIRIYCGA
ncbi:MAG: TipAS antibiotic-recognition domain-containing protein [Lachnospiraceae bacterium]|nr:TipAS antibiotic-recognition domain-containing protein [Lachnospiraceae bacterium]